jgi:bifunctional non-homologous end joining protein LigD
VGKKTKHERSRAPHLAEYRAKRTADGTPEPFSIAPGADRPTGLFVVQKHAARNMHFDLRLEMDGALKSWAVPKGPSLDPAVKRLAVRVEDHPVEYADFEGLIPEGNYGAGAVIVWDRGQWVPLEDPHLGMEKGKLLFELRGHKLRGVWTMFRTKRAEKEWLLVKKPDGYAGADKELAQVQESVFSGRRVEDLRDGVDPAEKLRAELARVKAPRGKVAWRTLEPMLPTTREEPFSDRDWVFEVKYDGFRMLAAREDEKGWLRYRRGKEATRTFPEIAAAVGRLPFDGVVLDGEIVVLDETGRPRFQALQQRFQIAAARDIARAALTNPATLFVFDLLAIEGHDLRPLPLLERKRILRMALPLAGPLRYSDHIAERGEEMFDGVGDLGLEGIVAKKADSPYREGRTTSWLRIRHDRTGDFVIVGYTEPKRGRAGLGALHLAFSEGERLIYAGRVGTGFDDALLRDLRAALEKHRRPVPACDGVPKVDADDVWVEPDQVCEVRYKEWTQAGQLRHPVFLRLREDKRPEECSRPGGPEPASPIVAGPEPAPEEPEVAKASPRKVVFTNLDKVFWPEEGYTKGDLIEFYRTVASFMLPYLIDRPLVLTRFPDGIAGKSFFQKDAPGFVPDWMRIETMWSEHAHREIRYFICDNEETLLYVANMASIPLHVWSSRASSLQNPDWCILDLDPKETPFDRVVRVARKIHELCDKIELPCFVKTSGSTGLHVLVPLARRLTYEQSRNLGQLLGQVVAAKLPDIATVDRSMRARKDKVYIDYVQNGHGRLLVAPYSVRPLPGAPVSTPVRWSEVNDDLDIRKFTIRTVPKRLAKMKGDPVRAVLDTDPDLMGALSRLHELV